MLERWTRAALRARLAILALWLVVLALGTWSAARLPDLLSNSFAVPGTESQRASDLLRTRFGEKPEGTFVAVWEVDRSTKELEEELHRRLARAAAVVPTGKAGELRDGDGILYGEIDSTLDLADAKRHTSALRRSLALHGAPTAFVTGPPAVQYDLDPILREDLRRAELVAVPIALAILLALLGLTRAVAIPFVFAACTIAATLGLVQLVARSMQMTTYVTALVELVGLGLAIDYSLLVVHRYREEIARGLATEEAVVRTMATAGRAIVTSGLAVAAGLAALLLVPVPFVRSLGVGALLVPLVSLVALLTLQPALLSILGGRAGDAPARSRDAGFWVRLANGIMRRPVTFLVSGTLALALLAAPALDLRLTPGSISGLPSSAEAMRGFALLSEGVGPGAVTPTQVAVEPNALRGSNDGPTRAAITLLADDLFHDPEVLLVASGKRPPYVDDARRNARVIVVGRHEYGDDASRRFVRRLREKLIPAAGFPADAEVNAGGVPPQASDFLERTYDPLPWIVLVVLGVTYLVLLRAFRSLLLPLKAVLLNLLTVAAVCGVLVAVFQRGWGASLLGVSESSEIDGWVPILLFATLFGLSMDYEVFLVSRMREAWDEAPDNTRAVALGLARSGRVVTAAAAIMVVAFAGFVLGRVPGLQQLGLGLALGVLLDATLVRMLVLPSLMAVLGRWNWWLPASVARLMRVEPSPLRP